LALNRDIIEEIKRANPIEDVIQQFIDTHSLPVNTNGSGIFTHHHFWKDDPNPGTALWVTPSNQLWSCFSCKQGGDVIHLVQSFLYGPDYEPRNYGQLVQSLHWLADRVGIPFEAPEEEDTDLAELRILYSIYGDFIDYCVKNSFSINKAQEIYELIDQRYPLNQETIEKFRICYFDRKWTQPFYNKLLEKYTHEELIGSGLFQQYKENINCIFQNRLIIPYIQNGDVVYMIGRETVHSSWEDENGIKKNYDGGKKFKKLSVYDESKVYTHHISKHVRNDYIFGSDFIKKGQDLLITEGIGDCLVLLQAGYNAISPVTVSFKNEMLEPVSSKLKRVRQIYICNDNELSEAGAKGALRMYDFFLSKGMDAKVVELPLEDGETHKDVAEYFQKHSVEDFKELLESSKSALDMQIETITPASHKLDVQKVWEKILNLDSFERDMKAESLAKKLGKRVKALKEWFGSSASGPLTSKMVFEAPARLIPAQDFKLDEFGTKRAYSCVWVPVQIDSLGNDPTIENHPHLIEMEYGVEGKLDKKIIDLNETPINPLDMQRIPDEALTFDRWRLDTKYPYSVGNFISAKSNLKPDVDAVFHSLYEIFDNYFWYPRESEKLIQTLYIMLSYFYQMFSAVPGLHMTGPKDSGKTNAMKIALWTAFNAFKVVSVKESFLFRTAHATSGVFIVDEAEKLTGEEKIGNWDDVMTLLRARYKQGDCVPRQHKDPEGKFITIMYDTYGPTYVGSISHLEDALASRMIIIECLTKDDLSDLKNFTNDEWEIQVKCADIKDKMYTLMMLDFPRVMAAHEIIKKDPRVQKIRNREWEKWRPLLTIAQWIDMSAKHTNKKLVDQLIEIQEYKQQLRKNAESSNNKELILLEIMLDILVNREGSSHNFKVLDIGDGNQSVAADQFYNKINEKLRAMSIQRQFDMQSKSLFDNALRKNQIWQVGDGKIEKGRIIINTIRLEEAINRLKLG
jgi:DNA primase